MTYGLKFYGTTPSRSGAWSRATSSTPLPSLGRRRSLPMPDAHAPPITASSSVIYQPDGLYRILSLDGGGAKGFYTLGVLKEIEGMIKCPLYQRFDLVFGTSTGAIIAALIALGYEVEKIHELYKKHVP